MTTLKILNATLHLLWYYLIYKPLNIYENKTMSLYNKGKVRKLFVGLTSRRLLGLFTWKCKYCKSFFVVVVVVVVSRPWKMGGPFSWALSFKDYPKPILYYYFNVTLTHLTHHAGTGPLRYDTYISHSATLLEEF